LRQYQIWESTDDYAISDLDNSKINFATNKDFKLKWKKKDVFETETATKPAFINHIRNFVTSYGVHPIFNSKGEACEQIVNMPDKVLTSKEIIAYLNKYTILPQETPPWEEVIYKLLCYSDVLTGEYIDKVGVSFPYLKQGLERSEEDIDEHYFVSSPKVFEKKRGSVFHLPKPNRAHRKWIILNEYYDFKKNAWIDKDSGNIENRKEERIEIVTNEKPIDKKSVSDAIDDFLKHGGKITNLNEKKDEPVFEWKKLKIHPLAKMIPAASGADRERLRKDIVLNGVFEPIKLYEGMVLDGRTRQELCVEEGIKPLYGPWQGPGTPEAYVESMNLKRRHLTPSQLATYGVERLLPKYEKEARERKKTNMNSLHTPKVEDAQKGEAAIVLAEFLQINKQYIYDAKSIKEKSPDIFNKVFNGDLNISEAKRIIKNIIPIVKKRLKRKKFELEYRKMLKLICDVNWSNHSHTALIRLSDIYLKWNKRNDKTMLSKLEYLKDNFPDIFSDNHKPKLELVSKNVNEELMEM
jgi:hypothetical protein